RGRGGGGKPENTRNGRTCSTPCYEGRDSMAVGPPGTRGCDHGSPHEAAGSCYSRCPMSATSSRAWGALLFWLVLTPAPLLAAPATRHAARPPAPALPQVIVPASASAHDLQIGEACRRGLGGIAGAVVAMDPHGGRVIAVVNPQNALLRAYTPCSVFKTVIAIAGLSEGIITPASVYNCQGGCSIWPGHGPVDLRRALAVSCNPYFEWVR